MGKATFWGDIWQTPNGLIMINHMNFTGQAEIEDLDCAKEVKANIESIHNHMAMEKTKLRVNIAVAFHIQKEEMSHFLEKADRALIKAHNQESGIFIPHENI